MKTLLSAKDAEISCNAARQKIDIIYTQCLANQIQVQELINKNDGLESETRIRQLQTEVDEWNKEYKNEIERIRLEHSGFMNHFEEIKRNVSDFKDNLETSLDRCNQLISTDSRTESQESELRQLIGEMEGFKIREKEINELKIECGMIQGQFLLFSGYLKDKGLLA